MGSEAAVTSILGEYDANHSVNEDFRLTCDRLVRELLNVEALRVHSVTSRVKAREKLKEKCERGGKSYVRLADVTDVVGIRIITHLADEVDRIGTLIEREFLIDRDRSIDKRKLLDPDRFGYLSLHYICSLSEGRASLTEHRRFKGLVCEIQIRSILQHAWAEIEHDLGYKAGATVPAPVRRRFSRLAGLLEIADAEFMQIRDGLEEYGARVQEQIVLTPDEIEIDNVSLQAFIEGDASVKMLDQVIAESLRCELEDACDVEGLVTYLTRVGISTIQELREAIRLNEGRMRALCAELEKVPNVGSHTVERGISLFHLFQVMIALQHDLAGVCALLGEFSIAMPDERLSHARLLLKAVGRPVE